MSRDMLAATVATGMRDGAARKAWQTPAVIDAVIQQNTEFNPVPNRPDLYDCCYFSAVS